MHSTKLSAAEIVALNREYVFFSWSVQAAVNPIPVERAKGVYFWDVDGKRYIDFASQLMNVNAGHQHPRIVQAIKDQADRLCYVYPGMATDVKGELGRLLAEITPGNLKKSFFVLGGAEANDNAIKLARLYTGRHKIIARYRSYHGATYGAIALSGDPRRLPVEPAIPGVIHVMDPYCYRCPFGWTLETCHRECIDHVEQVIQFEGPENVAAIFLEGVTGSSGIMIYPDEYWPRMREIADKYGILLVDDEVMSGFGRTGEWFGIDHWGVVPDIMTMAKGLTSAYVPLGAVVVSQDIADYFEERMLPLGLTYSGHALACATAIATINVYKEDGLIENARAMGRVLGEELEAMKARHPSVGDVRYIGLFSVIEVVKDKETKEPMAPWNARPSEMGAMAEVSKFLRDNGLYTFVRWNWIFVVPPLCITEAQLKEGLTIIDQALEITDAATKRTP
ncbi:MAG: aminotransferase class III-fold pyridoxal phosphate-dependent enzyme [Anaerolineae bacterium]|jgi:taurine--2-oxoglutarate transaminase|nr:aminotransferase class III-fold pyridoxal phosphate-dependent enzyme [Anaerolineae bacterium]MDH7472718.1 aminotransferase class III-fold pyridoxal phosphate-dependent enzyme [Anaerolineae bacterium]